MKRIVERVNGVEIKCPRCGSQGNAVLDDRGPEVSVVVSLHKHKVSLAVQDPQLLGSRVPRILDQLGYHCDRYVRDWRDDAIDLRDVMIGELNLRVRNLETSIRDLAEAKTRLEAENDELRSKLNPKRNLHLVPATRRILK